LRTSAKPDAPGSRILSGLKLTGSFIDMEQKIPQRTKWKFPPVETFNYQFNFLKYFTKHNPEFIREMETGLFPLHLDIFGRHEKTTSTLSEYNLMLAVAIAQKDYGLFFVQVPNKLKIVYDVANQAGVSEEILRSKTDILLDKITSIIKSHNLFFGSEDEDIPLWLAHSVLCQVEAGIPYLMTPMRQIFGLPSKMLEELWRELPEVEQVLLMRAQEIQYKQEGSFNWHKEQFKSLDDFMKTFPFKTLPPAPMFGFREYNIFEDMENYEKMAVEAYKQHIKNYTKRMSNALNECFKRNKADEYCQTEWLVIWNKHTVKYLWEILPYITDFQKVDLNNTNAKIAAVDRLETAFNKFEKFDLPVRPFGRKRKKLRKRVDANILLWFFGRV